MTDGGRTMPAPLEGSGPGDVGAREYLALLHQAQELVALTFAQVDLATGRRVQPDNYEAVLGFAPCHLFDDFLAHVHPDDRPRIAEFDSIVRSRLGKLTASFRVIGDDGAVRWIETRAETNADATGAPARILITHVNVTDRKRAEEEIYAGAERLRRTQSAARVGIWDWDILRNEGSWSAEGWPLFGGDNRGKLNWESWLAVVHSEDRERAAGLAHEAMEKGRSVGEYRIVEHGGAVRWVRDLAVCDRAADGSPIRLRGVTLDITETRQALEQKLSSEARFSAFMDHTPVIAWAKDASGRYVYISGTYERRFNLREQDVLGKTDPEIWPRATAEHFRRSDLDVLASGVPSTCMESAPEPSGEICHWWNHKFLYRDAAGNGYVGGVGLDVTEWKLAEQALKDADRRKDVFLATLGHELRNPLVPLRTAVGILEQLEIGEPRLASLRATIDRQVEHLTRLVDDLLDVSRISRGSFELRRSPCDLSDVVRDALELTRPLVQSLRHHLVVDVPTGRLLVEGDAVRLTQAVSNLITNAAKYTPPGGSVRLVLTSDGGSGVIRVEDNGIGIDASALPHVFDAFMQAPQARAHAPGGLGIGLMLVKQIAELHGGSAEARSPGPGQGSQFALRLPLLAVGAAAAEPAPRERPAMLASVGTRVLIVDDYAAIRDSLDMLLTLRGFVVKSAEDGSVALRIAREFKPHVAIVDMRMPGMNGLEVGRRLREMRELSGLLLIAMTGEAADQDRDAALAAGFDQHIVKPVRAARLLELLSARPQAVVRRAASGT